MKRPSFVEMLLGLRIPLPLATASRVHRCADDDIDDPRQITPSELARRVGCTRRAAQFRIRKAQQSGDWSQLLAPIKSTNAAPAAQRPTQGKKEAHMGTKDHYQAGVDAAVKAEHNRGRRIMAASVLASIQTGQTDKVSMGLALFESGVTADASERVLGAKAGAGETFGEMLQNGMQAGMPAGNAESIAAQVIASGEKAGFNRGTRGGQQ